MGNTRSILSRGADSFHTANQEAVPPSSLSLDTDSYYPAEQYVEEIDVEQGVENHPQVDVANLSAGGFTKAEVDALARLERKLAHRLKSIAADWAKDPKYALWIARPNDPHVMLSTRVWAYGFTPFYVCMVMAFAVWTYLLMLEEEYDAIQKTGADAPPMAVWAFQGYRESRGTFQYLGPVSWSFIYLTVATPIFLIQCWGGCFLDKLHYTILFNEWNKSKEYLEEARNESEKEADGLSTRRYTPAFQSWPHEQIKVIIQREFVQGCATFIGSVVTVFFSTSFVESILNMLALHFLAECDEYAIRDLLYQGSYTLGRSNPKKPKKGKRRRLDDDEYENIWSLNKEWRTLPNTKGEKSRISDKIFGKALDLIILQEPVSDDTLHFWKAAVSKFERTLQPAAIFFACCLLAVAYIMIGALEALFLSYFVIWVLFMVVLIPFSVMVRLMWLPGVRLCCPLFGNGAITRQDIDKAHEVRTVDSFAAE